MEACVHLLGQSQFFSVEGGSWSVMHPTFGLQASPAMKAVAVCEWHTGGKWHIVPGVEAAICGPECFLSAVADPWHSLLEAARRLPAQPQVLRPNVSERMVQSFAVGLRRDRDGGQYTFLPPGSRQVLAALYASLEAHGVCATFQVIQLNASLAAAHHTDGINIGPS